MCDTRKEKLINYWISGRYDGDHKITYHNLPQSCMSIFLFNFKNFLIFIEQNALPLSYKQYSVLTPLNFTVTHVFSVVIKFF